MSVEHHTLVHERDFAHPRRAVFEAWSSPELKRAWFDFSDDPEAEWQMDFRIDGHELFRSRPGATPESTYDATYRDIVEHERIVLTAEITLAGRRSSVSLSTAQFAESKKGTTVTVTEQITFLDGIETPADRRGGTTTQLDRLATFLDRTTGAEGGSSDL